MNCQFIGEDGPHFDNHSKKKVENLMKMNGIQIGANSISTAVNPTNSVRLWRYSDSE